eukprot:13206062-Alexandrium_andersonii.AAC.1
MLTSASSPAAGGPGRGPAVPLESAAGAAGPWVAVDRFLAIAQASRAPRAFRLRCQADRCPLVGQTPSGPNRRP